MTNETFRTEAGHRITVERTWAGIRIVLHTDTRSTIGKNSFSTKEAALEELRANSTRAS
jgi:hypothetical protein